MGNPVELIFRKGQPFAAYYRFGAERAKGTYTKQFAPHLLVNFDGDGRPVGLDILAFDAETLSRINEVLESVGVELLSDDALASLQG